MQYQQVNKPAHYLGNPNLKAAGVQISFTSEQVSEYLKCAQDPIYFLETYAKIVSLDKGIVPFQLFPYQRRMIEAVHHNKNTIGKLFRQAGKCVSYDTMIKLRNKKTGEILEISIGDFYSQWERKPNK